MTEGLIMKTYRGTQEVDPGLYFSMKKFSLKSIDDRGPLPGTADDEYRRVPMLIVLAFAPLLGLAYVMFLPFIGFAMVTWLVGHKALQLGASAATEMARVLRPGWEPSFAFLSRSKPAKKEEKQEDAPDTWAEEIEKKLDETDRRG
jgi:hypothetical protein